MDGLITLIGLTAGTLTTFANLPQLLKSWETRSTKDLSLEWIVILFVGVLLWLVYGILAQDLPVMLANSFTLLLVVGLLYLKLKYK